MRPFGALVFGRLGDMIGRKYTFLVTILIMGLSTFVVGLLPGFTAIGVAAPVILIGLRMLQGLALGGEYGGAATYVAEHAPHGKRGAFTAWIQTTATLGLCLSIVVIVATRAIMGEAAFADWGWRIPFLMSVLLLAVSVWIRLSMNESPAFKKMKEEGRTSKAPLSESFGQWKNLKIVILALVGLTMGQAVVWYSGQFYAQIFLKGPLKVDANTADIMISLALVIGTPFFIVFGTLSDKIGRKPIIMAGCLLCALTYFPVVQGVDGGGQPRPGEGAGEFEGHGHRRSERMLVPVQPDRTIKFTSSCDVAKQVLSAGSVSYENVAGSGPARITIGDKTIEAYAAKGLPPDELKAKDAAFKKDVGAALKEHGYPTKADPEKMNKPLMMVLLVLVIYVTMVYGPIAAMLVEMFPTRIRYTSMSLPYHIGNGWFGGLLPATAVAIVRRPATCSTASGTRSSSRASPSWSACCSSRRRRTWISTGTTDRQRIAFRGAYIALGRRAMVVGHRRGLGALGRLAAGTCRRRRHADDGSA